MKKSRFAHSLARAFGGLCRWTSRANRVAALLLRHNPKLTDISAS